MIDKNLIEKLKKLESEVLKRIKGQDHVINNTCKILKQGMLDLTKESKPRGTFLFLGPTGVGKTEFTLQFTNYLFDDNKMFRFDMSEFMLIDSIKNLIGNEKGSTGRLGLVLEHHTTGTLLFDEMEKAHPQIMDIFLQILDAGRITLGNHKTYDLSGFFIVLTSNVGSQRLLRAKSSAISTIEGAVIGELKKKFRPEFIGRFDDISIFRSLGYEIQKEIAKLLLDNEVERMHSKGYIVSYDESILYYCIRHGINEHFGARPLRGTIYKTIQSAIAEDLLVSSNGDGCGTLYFDNTTQKINLEKKEIKA